jgi:hypothetical protein
MALRIFLLLLIPCFAQAQINTTTNYHALLIGISQYPNTKPCAWPPLSGIATVDSMRSILVNKGFPTNQISCPSKATKTAISSAFETLTETVQRDAVVLIFFSMHGQQIPDDNGDEQDNMDESLIPYDCPMYSITNSNCPWPTDYKGDKHLRDDEIGVLLNKLRAKIGSKGEVMVVMDGCHTGTGTRTISYSNSPKIVTNVEPVFQEGSSRHINMAPIICFFAQLPSREVLDNKFSQAVCEALKAADKNTTYKSFFNAVTDRSKSKFATPNYEDLYDLYEKPLLGGELSGWKDRIAIKNWITGKVVKIGLGTLSNVFSGTEIEFFSDKGGDTPIATGEVTKHSADEAEVTLNVEINLAGRAGVWGRIVKWRVGDKPLLVKNALISPLYKNAIQKEVGNNANFKLSPDTSNIQIIEKGHSIFIYRGRDSLTQFNTQNILQDFVTDDVIRFLLQYQRQVTLSELNYESPEVRVEWKIIPVGTDCKIKGQSFERKKGTELFVLQTNTHFGIEIKNISKKEIFFALLDFPSTQHPDLANTILIPYAGTTATDFSLQPGATWQSKECWKTTPPYGIEKLKLITSTKPLQNLQQAVKTRSLTIQIEQPISDGDMYDVNNIFLEIIKSDK